MTKEIIIYFDEARAVPELNNAIMITFHWTADGILQGSQISIFPGDSFSIKTKKEQKS